MNKANIVIIGILIGAVAIGIVIGRYLQEDKCKIIIVSPIGTTSPQDEPVLENLPPADLNWI